MVAGLQWIRLVTRLNSNAVIVSGDAADPKTKGKVTYTNDLTSYNSASQNAALTTFMEANKAKFGTIWYYNNGGNVETFKVKVPITIAYEWGEFTTEVEFTIKRYYR